MTYFQVTIVATTHLIRIPILRTYATKSMFFWCPKDVTKSGNQGRQLTQCVEYLSLFSCVFTMIILFCFDGLWLWHNYGSYETGLDLSTHVWGSIIFEELLLPKSLGLVVQTSSSNDIIFCILTVHKTAFV